MMEAGTRECLEEIREVVEDLIMSPFVDRGTRERLVLVSCRVHEVLREGGRCEDGSA